jgi:hypothetical protein
MVVGCGCGTLVVAMTVSMYLWKWDGNREVGTVASMVWKDDDAIATWWLAVGVVHWWWP